MGLQHLPLALATLLALTSVFWATLLSRFLMREVGSREETWYSLITFFGIVVAIVGKKMNVAWSFSALGVSFGLLGGFCKGSAMTLLKRIRQEVATKEVVFFFGAFGVLVLGPVFCLSPKFPQTSMQWGLVFLVASAGTAGQLFLSAGMRYTGTVVGTVCTLPTVLFSVVFGLLVFGETPPLSFFAGAVFALAGLLGLIRKYGRGQKVLSCQSVVQSVSNP